MNRITWTITLSDSRCSGTGLDSCWKKIRSLTDKTHFTLRIFYHGDLYPPKQVWPGPSGWKGVQVTFSSYYDLSDHQWFSVRPTARSKYFNCSRWNISEIEQFISFYTQQ